MKVEVLQENLSKTLAICARFASSKVQLPILANVSIQTSSNKIYLKATNLETSVSFVIGAKVIEEGSITVPAKSFYEIVSNLSKGNLTLIVNKEQLNILQEDYEASLTGINSSDFPEVISSIGKKFLKFKAVNFKNAIEDVLFSVSSDEARPVLNGVLFIFDKNISLVSTDGFRLTKTSMEIDSSDCLFEKVIIPKNVLSEVIRVFQEDDIFFSFSEDDKQVVFSDNLSCVLSSRVIDGDFPNFEKIIPKETKITVDVSKEDFLQAVKLASVFARGSSNIVTLTVQKEEMVVKSENSTAGKQTKKVSVKVSEEIEDEVVIAFNYHFLEDLLKIVKGESIEMRITSPSSAVLFLDPKNKEFIHLIMPVKLI